MRGHALFAARFVMVVALLLVLAPVQARGVARRPVPGGVISTLAGGAGGPGRATSVATQACGVQAASGSLYVGDEFTVRRISETTGALVTVAGNYAAGPAGDGGPAAGTALSQACGAALDPAGNLVIADGSVVRVVAAAAGTFYGQAMIAGDIYLVAGGGSTILGDGGPATQVRLGNPTSVTTARRRPDSDRHDGQPAARDIPLTALSTMEHVPISRSSAPPDFCQSLLLAGRQQSGCQQAGVFYFQQIREPGI